jgi:putative nucleotidyltransferase with HDIG domain
VLLVVADDAAVRETIRGGLERGAYRIIESASAAEGMEALRRTRLDPALLVVRLAGGAADFLGEVWALDPSLGAIVIGGDGAGAALRGGEGAALLGEPFDDADLLGAVEYLLRRRLGRIAETEWRRRTEGEILARHTALERRLEQFAVASLDVLVTALEARDPFMSGHSMRVAQLSASLADGLGHTEEEVESVRLAGRLHDIGMTVISEQVLNRKGPLTAAERDQIRQHPVLGQQMLQPYAHLAQAARFVRGHHERWDGRGYPDGLRGEEIPWGARILAVAETYDALVTSRAYTVGVLTPNEARIQLQSEAGTVFDPATIEALAGVVGNRRALEFVVAHDPAHPPAAPAPVAVPGRPSAGAA